MLLSSSKQIKLCSHIKESRDLNQIITLNELKTLEALNHSYLPLSIIVCEEAMRGAFVYIGSGLRFKKSRDSPTEKIREAKG